MIPYPAAVDPIATVVVASFLPGNPSLCALNLDLRSAPIIETRPIAATKSTRPLANARACP